MQPLSFFKDRIGEEILRGTTVVKVTELNFEKLFKLQNIEQQYFFKDKNEQGGLTK